MTELPPDARFNFVFAAPDGSPAWELSLDAVTEQLLAVDPESETEREYGSGRFATSFPFGGVEGSMRSDMITYKLASTRTATAFVRWLRSRVLPAGTGIAFMTHEAIELDAAPCTLPDTDDPAALEAAMLPYLRDVTEADGR